MPVLETYDRLLIRTFAEPNPIVNELPVVLPAADPFGIDDTCVNPAGHHFIASCGDVVCVHCTKVVWQ
jgi:hypothetical protein